MFFNIFFEKWAAQETQILKGSITDIRTQFIHTYRTNFWTIHFQCSQQQCLSATTFLHARPQKSAGPNSKQYPTASVLCKSGGKPSTRFPLGRHVELKTCPKYLFVRQSKILYFECSNILLKFGTCLNLSFVNGPRLILTHNSFIHINLDSERYTLLLYELFIFPAGSQGKKKYK